jgi:hypothetical protein
VVGGAWTGPLDGIQQRLVAALVLVEAHPGNKLRWRLIPRGAGEQILGDADPVAGAGHQSPSPARVPRRMDRPVAERMPGGPDRSTIQVMDDVEGADRAGSETSRPRLQLNTRLVIGSAVLIGVGGLLGLIGAVIGSSALLAATRRWVNQLETPPRELARRRWEQTKAATVAGADA